MSAALTISHCTVASEWDAAIWANARGNIFAAWMWGAYKSRIGWTVTRLIIRDANGDPVALIQYQVRVRGFLRSVLVQGGPLLTPKGEKHAEAAMGAFVEHLALGRFDLLVISFEHAQSDPVLIALLGHHFVPVQSHKYYTLELDLARGTEPILQGMDQRWRKALRKAERNAELTTRFLTDPSERLAAFDAFWTMYGALQARKGFRDTLDGTAFRDLVANDPHHRILEVRENGTCILVRIAHVSAERFTDFYTASNDRARACGAPTLAVWRFIEQAHAEGVRFFDLGGIDPGKNRGTFEFKHGLSKTLVSSGPRWIYCRTPRLRDAVGAFLAFR
ncbi:GNAT family N-acetyltransferase [Methylobacterium sp. BTF04]|uniref:lipid II:glycine glycyltransferase FemX n=1 Tax=Methylobacterium sp. BTF04 TaxID=2708300 RepID=UPI0013D3AB55|nr:GNAT family N-acetyltransferase [Methylobacterium sp. BTF04]NEU11685.1 GNAT family N-acetyltransferase [Methylobacterium sp. BTF04]